MPETLISPDRQVATHYQSSNYTGHSGVGYLMHRIVALLARDIEHQMDPLGLTNAQWKPLVKLHLGQKMTVAELARECDMDCGAMTRLLDRLESKGLCQRTRSSEDRRVVNLELTDAGRAAALGIPDVLCRVQNHCLQGFSTEEWQTLKGYLQRMLANAQTDAPAEAVALPLALPLTALPADAATESTP